MLRLVAATALVAVLAAMAVLAFREGTPPPAEPRPAVPEPPAPLPPEPPPPVPDEPPGVNAMRAALFGEDQAAALHAARELPWTALSHQEQARAVAILLAHFRAGGDDVQSALHEMLSSDELTGLLADFPEHGDGWQAANILEDFHRMSRAGHIGALARLAKEATFPHVRKAARTGLAVLSANTDRYRNTIAGAMLGEGEPPTLAAVLCRLADPEGREDFDADVGWAARWLWDEPLAVDAAILLAAARTRLSWLETAAVRAMGHQADEETRRYLVGRRAFSGRDDTRPWVIAALARRGDADALRELAGRAVRDSAWLGALHDLSPEKAAATLTAAFVGRDEAAAHAALDAFADTLVTGDSGLGIVWDRSLFAGVEDAALRSKASGLRLARIGAVVPGARTRRLAERAARLLREHPPDPDFAGTSTSDWRVFLEFGVPGQFPVSGPEDADELHAVAVRFGLPAEVALTEDLRGRVGADDWEWFERMVRAGRPVDALVEFFRAHPAEPVWHIGLIDDPRIREHLRQVRDRRELGLYHWATTELAMAGEPEAKREHWAAITAGRYRWVDDSDALDLTMGGDLGTIPFFLDELESNCCRFASVGCVFEDLFGIDPGDLAWHPRTTAVKALRAWWAENGDRLVRSRISGKYVPEVE